MNKLIFCAIAAVNETVRNWREKNVDINYRVPSCNVTGVGIPLIQIQMEMSQCNITLQIDFYEFASFLRHREKNFESTVIFSLLENKSETRLKWNDIIYMSLAQYQVITPRGHVAIVYLRSHTSLYQWDQAVFSTIECNFQPEWNLLSPLTSLSPVSLKNLSYWRVYLDMHFNK